MKKIFYLIPIFVLLFCQFLLATEKKVIPSQTVIVDRIVCIVGKEAILQSEVNQLIASAPPNTPLTEKQALDLLISEQVVSQEIKKLNLEVTAEEMDQTIKSVMKQYNLDNDNFSKALRAQGLSLDEYKEQLKKQLYKMKLIQTKIKNRVKISDDDIKISYQDQYEANAKEFKVHLQYLLFKNKTVSSKEKAQAAFVQLKSGKEFPELSKSLISEKNIVLGDFGEVRQGELLSHFEKYAFSLPEQGFSPPIETATGYFILFVSKRVPVDKIPLEKVEKDLHKQLYEKEIEQEFQRYIDELKASIYIENRFKKK